MIAGRLENPTIRSPSRWPILDRSFAAASRWWINVKSPSGPGNIVCGCHSGSVVMPGWGRAVGCCAVPGRSGIDQVEAFIEPADLAPDHLLDGAT